MPPMLDEAALRRPEFTEGPRVRLGDGRVWTFPKPVYRFFPAPKGDGTFDVAQSPPYGAKHQADLERLMDVQGDTPEDAAERVDLCLRMAGELLNRNYALDAAAFEALLPMENSPENHAMWNEIHLVLRGIATTPKPTAVG